MNPAVPAIARTVLALAAFLLAGCARQGNPEANRVVVEVTQDPAELQRAREAWSRQQEETLVDALAHPARIARYNDEILELVRSNRARALAALTSQCTDASEPPETRLQAALALRFLDSPANPETLADLASQSDEAARALLFELNDLYPRDVPLPAAIEHFVIAALNHRTEHIRTSALRIVTYRGLASAAPCIEAGLSSAQPVDDAWLEAAARLCPSRSVLHQLVARLQPSSLLSSGPTLGSIATLGMHTNEPELRREAVDACIRYLSAQPDQPWMDFNTSTAVDFLAGLQPRDEAQAQLTRLATGVRWRLIRDQALAELHKLDPVAAGALATKMKVDPESIREHRAAATAPLHEWADRCVAASILTRAEADAALAASQAAATEDGTTAGAASGTDDATALTVLDRAHRFLFFDVETGSFPNRHDRLILDFARASAGRFTPEAARETCDMARDDDYDGATYTVEFIHHDRLYRVRPKNLGDWYDVEAVVAVIDRALADAGISERFVCTAADGQCVGFIFGDPVKITAAAKDLGLQIEGDVDSSRRAGIEYEESMRKILDP